MSKAESVKLNAEGKPMLSDKKYYTVVNGTFRLQVPEGTEGAVKRENKNGKVVNELPFRTLFGKIEGVEFEEREFEGSKFSSLKIYLDKDEDEQTPVISLGAESKYARDLLHKLPNVDLEEDVRFRPFAFVPDGEDKEVTGMEVMQRDNATGNFEKKIDSFFFKKQGEKNVPVNGFPTREKAYDDQTESERKIYLITRNQFLIDYTRNHIIPHFMEVEKDDLEDAFKDSSDEESIDSASIPF